MSEIKLRKTAIPPENEGTEDFEVFRLEEISRAEATMKPHIRFKSLRKEMKLTQSEFADFFDVSRKTIQLYEGGKLSIPSAIIGKLAAHYDIDIHHLFTGRPFPSAPATKMANAQVAVSAFRYAAEEFLEIGMSLDEIERITLAYARSHEAGEPFNQIDLMTCVKIVTGDKYLPY